MWSYITRRIIWTLFFITTITLVVSYFVPNWQFEEYHNTKVVSIKYASQNCGHNHYYIEWKGYDHNNYKICQTLECHGSYEDDSDYLNIKSGKVNFWNGEKFTTGGLWALFGILVFFSGMCFFTEDGGDCYTSGEIHDIQKFRLSLLCNWMIFLGYDSDIIEKILSSDYIRYSNNPFKPTYSEIKENYNNFKKLK